jgi:parvulin-like peptidyl-prolyl isomerase
MFRVWLAVIAMATGAAIEASAADDGLFPTPVPAVENEPSAEKMPATDSDAEKTEKSAGKTADKSAGTPRIVAWVNGTPVYFSDVQRSVTAVAAGRKFDDENLAYLQATILQQLIGQAVVVKFLESEHLLVTMTEIDAAIEEYKEKLKQQKRTWKEYLEQTKQTESGVRKQKSWEMALDKYVARNMSDENLEEYFKHNKAQFDGTERRISHILLRPVGSSDTGARDLMIQAEQLRGRIRVGELTFEAAVAKYSDGPSRRNGGDLGFFPRHGEMADPLMEVAFALKPRETGPPVLTSFGVHLIQVTDERPGQKTWQETREALKAAYSRYLIERMIADQNAKAKIEFAENFPHFAPGTRELVLPPAAVGAK